MEDRCIICREIIPEGRHICINCEYKYKDMLEGSTFKREQVTINIGDK